MRPIKHFLVFYTFTDCDSGRGFGEWYSRSSLFPNRAQVIAAINESLSATAQTVIITNIIEVSSDDVEDWLA